MDLISSVTNIECWRKPYESSIIMSKKNVGILVRGRSARVKQPKRAREQREEAGSCNEMMTNDVRNACSDIIIENEDHAIRTRSVIGVHWSSSRNITF